MRVLLDVSAVPARPVGAGVYTLRLAAGLAARDDVELHLLSRRDDADRWRSGCPAAMIHPEVPRRRPLRLAWERLQGAACARRIAPDVWHGPHYTLPDRLPTAAVVTIHDLTFFDHPEWHERVKVPFFTRAIRRSTARADTVVAVSEFTARRLVAVSPPRAPVVVAPHGVDHDGFRPAGDEAERAADLVRLRRHGITPPYVAFAGTLEPRKGVPGLVEAFSLLAPERPDLRLVLAGAPGWGIDAVRASVERGGVATRVLRPGYLPDAALAALYRHAEAVAYPSLQEGFGLPALEALACGAPLVTTTGSAIEEVTGDAAVLAPPGDPIALARALAAVLDSPARAAELRAAGPRRAAGFTWGSSVARHVEAYEVAVKARAVEEHR